MSCHKNLGESKNFIKNRFYQDYDPSLILQCLANEKQLEPIGRGYHFSSFKLVGQGGFPYALSIARAGFLMGAPLKQWLAALGRVLKMSHPLIPPMEYGIFDDKAYYLTPYCGRNLTSRKNLDELLNELSTALQHQGLLVDDYWQVKLMDDHPFVIDWSDLKAYGF